MHIYAVVIEWFCRPDIQRYSVKTIVRTRFAVVSIPHGIGLAVPVELLYTPTLRLVLVEKVEVEGVIMRRLRYKARNGAKAIRSWVIPWFKSRMRPNEFRPILCYMFTEWNCNIDCHYCFQYDTARPGMSIETAKSAVDYLKSIGCRVIPIMGGEPLMRPDFVVELVRYGAQNGFFMYLPTNGYLLTKELIDEIGQAGVSAINLAVDCVFPKKGLPKALTNIERQFRYLVEAKEKYGYVLFLNMNICRNNIKDVRLLTEIARANDIATDYHLNEPPQDVTACDHWKHEGESLYVTKEQIPEVEALLDWIIEKEAAGWTMVNSRWHLENLKNQLNGRPMAPWACRAGQNGAMIRPDGSLVPCFGMLSYDHDWGRIWEHKFERGSLDTLKKKCSSTCSSTCFHTMSFYYNKINIPSWVKKHMRVG